MSPFSLRCCTLMTTSCQYLTSALRGSSTLKELDLSYNKLMDQGVTLLSDWLPEDLKLQMKDSDWLFGYLTRASTVSEETVGDGAMTTTGSPSNISSQNICRWIRTDWKHLDR